MKEKGQVYVHPSAIIDDGVKIGIGTKIWHFVHIAKGAKIGKNCSFGQNAYVAPRAVIGNGVRVQNNVSIYDEVILKDDVFCGPSCVFTNVINPRAHISRKHEYKKTIVEKGTSIGANATIVCGVKLGQFSFIGAGAVVNRNVEQYELVVGVPIRHAGWMCECGVKLNIKNSNIQCKECKKKYKLVKTKLIRAK